MQRKAVCLVCVSLCAATPVPLSRSGSDITAVVHPSLSSPYTPRPLTSGTHGILLLVTRHQTWPGGGGFKAPTVSDTGEDVASTFVGERSGDRKRTSVSSESLLMFR